ncbi:MAG TPA: DUF3857 domain-containing protein, partial [Flavobacteriales bacterium]|nr:DUF3857 domain-containing protein [Flavobacteriales bacterium]
MSPRPILLGAAILLMAFASAQSRHYRTGPPGAWVKEQPLGTAVTDTACLQGGDEILLLDRQYDLAGQQVYWRRADRLISAEGVQNGSRVEIGFDPTFQELIIHHLRIVRGGTIMDKLDPGQLRVLHREEDMNSYLYDGTITVVADLQDVRVGDVVDYAVSIKGWNPAEKGRFHRYLAMGFDSPVARMFTRVVAPPGRSPMIQQHLFDPQPEVRKTALGTETSWTQEAIPCMQVDERMPGLYDPYPSIELSEFGSVEDLRRWALDQYAVDRRISGALAAHVKGIERLPDVMQRIDSAIDLVQRDVRYLGLEDGISAYRPHEPVKVYDQRFGDCKDKSLLLVAVLEAMGVKAYPALVNTSNGRSLDEHLPRPGLFDHCITMVPHAGDTLWVDATAAHNQGRGTQRYTPNYGKALVVGAGFKDYTTMHVSDTGVVDVIERIRLDTLGGGADIVIETRCHGRRADGIRSEFSSQSFTDIARSYTDFYAGIYGVCTPVEP